MKRIYLLALTAFCLLSCSRSVVESPDHSLLVSFRLNEKGSPLYCVQQDNKTVIDWSALGFSTEEADLTNGFTLVSQRQQSHSETWETVWGEERFITDSHQEWTIELKHLSGIRMNIIFRAFNDGIAFRYAFPDADRQLTITDERTE